jgi:hypothetical protein
MKSWAKSTNVFILLTFKDWIKVIPLGLIWYTIDHMVPRNELMILQPLVDGKDLPFITSSWYHNHEKEMLVLGLREKTIPSQQ